MTAELTKAENEARRMLDIPMTAHVTIERMVSALRIGGHQEEADELNRLYVESVEASLPKPKKGAR